MVISPLLMPQHQSVLLSTVLDLLTLSPGMNVLDVTVGLGGHSAAMAEVLGPSGTLVCLDADSENLHVAESRLASQSANIHFIHANFSCLPDCLPEDVRSFDAILADLGLSSPHIDDPKRGFSFRGNAPLDMRFDTSGGRTAADVLNESTESDLLTIFRTYGELSHAQKIVRHILKRRKSHPFLTAGDLVEVATECFAFRTPKLLPQIFQALRIAVNDELGSLQSLLASAPTLLSPNGMLAIITYHSLEDRLVKHALRDLCTVHTDPITGRPVSEAQFSLITKKSIQPSSEEIENNSRARSARLRVIQRRGSSST